MKTFSKKWMLGEGRELVVKNQVSGRENTTLMASKFLRSGKRKLKWAISVPSETAVKLMPK